MSRLLLIIFFIPFTVSSYGFFDERYRGWIWFEKPEQPKNQEMTPEHAENVIENMRRDMDEKRNIMIVNPTAETVREYIAAEDLMWKKALRLDLAYREAKFKYPEYFDLLAEPKNIYAVKFKRKLEREVQRDKIKTFAAEFDLVLLSKEYCGYCKEFAPILKAFGTEYGFKIEEASSDGKTTGLFVGKSVPDLGKKLGVSVTPAVIAISKRGQIAFELVRGYVSLSELEEYGELAHDYVEKNKL